MSRRTWLTTTLMTVLAAAAGSASAGTVGLAWNPSSGAAGYRVHWGSTPGSYTTSRDVGNTTATVLTGVANCDDSFFAVTAYNAAGESGYSNEVNTWPRAEVTSLTPTRVEQGSQFTLTFRGMNFDPSKNWKITLDPDPCVADPSAPGGKDCPMYYDPHDLVVTCDRVELVPSVEPLAAGQRPTPVGTYRLTLGTTDGAQQAPARDFIVDMNVARANVNRNSTDATVLRLDGADLASFVRLWMQCDPLMLGSSCAPGNSGYYDPDFDFDGNGRIDGTDLAEMMGARWGGCWSGSTWSVSACPQWLR